MKSLFSRLPAIWKDLDLRATPVVNGKGLLERYLRVGDIGLQIVENYIKEFLRSHNSEEIRSQFLPLLVELTGARWKSSKSRQWNRNRLQASIPRASYKGSHQCIMDLARECGASFCDIRDMSSTVLVDSVQGTYGEDDSWYFDADYYHPGVFLLFFLEDADLVAFFEDFKYIRPTGTKWYSVVLVDEGGDSDSPYPDATSSCCTVGCDAGFLSCGTIFYDEVNGFYEYYDWVPEYSVTPVLG